MFNQKEQNLSSQRLRKAEERRRSDIFGKQMAEVFRWRVEQVDFACHGKIMIESHAIQQGANVNSSKSRDYAEATESARKICEKKGLPEFCKWSVGPGSDLLMCSTGKHGTNTWASYFLELYGYSRIPGNGSVKQQVRALEHHEISHRDKRVMIEENRNPGHKFISFFVCRNPVDKLLSIYNFNVFRSTVKGASHLEGFPAGGPPPSWEEWIKNLAAGKVKSGLDSPLRLSCQPCHHTWDAVVHMETFDRDSRVILGAFGKSLLTPQHLNQHQRKSQENISLEKEL